MATSRRPGGYYQEYRLTYTWAVNFLTSYQYIHRPAQFAQRRVLYIYRQMIFRILVNFERHLGTERVHVRRV